MKSTNAHTEKKEMSLSELRAFMQAGLEPSPCAITPRDPQPPDEAEDREFMPSSVLWSDLKERMSDE